jgi:hypothetical protein
MAGAVAAVVVVCSGGVGRVAVAVACRRGSDVAGCVVIVVGRRRGVVVVIVVSVVVVVGVVMGVVVAVARVKALLASLAALGSLNIGDLDQMGNERPRRREWCRCAPVTDEAK